MAVTYTPTAGVFDPPAPNFFGDLLAGIFSLPGNLLNMLQMTPQLPVSEFESPIVKQNEIDQILYDINNYGLFGSVFTQSQLDEAFYQNAHGNADPLRAIVDRINQERNYSAAYSGLEQTYKDLVSGGDYAGLINQLKKDIESPIFSTTDIAAQVAGNTRNVLDARDRNVEVGKETLAGRGILDSGITADLVTQARDTADVAVRAGNIDIPIAARAANAQARTTAEGILANLLGTKTQQEANLGMALGQLREGQVPIFNSNVLANALQEAKSNRALLEFSNKMLTKQSLGETKQDAQNMFEDMMSVFGLIASMEDGGGSSKQKTGGGFSVLGTGGSKSCIDQNAIVITPIGCKRLWQVQAGDKVLTPSGFKKVLFIDIGFVPEKDRDQYLKFITNKRPLVCTASHRINNIPASEYKVGDHFKSFKTNYKILRIVPVIYRDCADLLLENETQYFVNGILVDSMLSYLKEQYATRKSRKHNFSHTK